MGEGPKVTIYTKPDCKLCGPVFDVAERVRRDIPFDLEKVDISGDGELTRRYGNEIPVVLIDGRKAFKGRMTEQAFRKRVNRSAKSRPKADAAPEVEALEQLAPRPFVPPRPVTLALIALVLGLFGAQVARGITDAQTGLGRVAQEILRVEERTEAPLGFKLETLDGKHVDLADLRDKVVFINFWATWCPPCIEEMPSLRRLATEFGHEDRLVMLAVSADDTWEPVREFFQKEPAPFTVLLDPAGEVAKRYGTTKFPETYVVVDGVLVGYIVGPRDWDTWFAKAYLKGLLDHGRS